MRNVLPLLFSLVVLGVLGACSTPQKPEERTSLVRGSRLKSRAVKASESRPHAWDDEKRPFQADRLDVGAYAERQRRRHRDGHSKQIVVMERFSHPACSGLGHKDRAACPLLSVRWREKREVPGGMAVVGAAQKVSGPQMHRRVLCHVAFGRVRGTDDGCPLHLPRVRTRVLQRESRLELVIVTDDANQVEELRRRVNVLVQE